MMGYQELKFELPKVRDMKIKIVFLAHFTFTFLAALAKWFSEVCRAFTQPSINIKQILPE